ncbi:MAG: hypothetical protein JWP89_3183 [Schlesneria sp.]|nr:hypothetical protein [Schlesneria sp.]
MAHDTSIMDLSPFPSPRDVAVEPITTRIRRKLASVDMVETNAAGLQPENDRDASNDVAAATPMTFQERIRKDRARRMWLDHLENALNPEFHLTQSASDWSDLL